MNQVSGHRAIKIMNSTKLTLLLLGSAVLTACSAGEESDSNLYHWGNYADTVYRYYNEPNDFGRQEADLQEIIAKAKGRNKPVAPGLYGHLGLVLLKQGKTAEAYAAFQQEQQLYPESKTFMQYLQHRKK